MYSSYSYLGNSLRESEKNIPMLLLHVMMTLKKLLFVNTALLSVDQDGNGLRQLVHDPDLTLSPRGVDNVHVS